MHFFFSLLSFFHFFRADFLVFGTCILFSLFFPSFTFCVLTSPYSEHSYIICFPFLHFARIAVQTRCSTWTVCTTSRTSSCIPGGLFMQGTKSHTKAIGCCMSAACWSGKQYIRVCRRTRTSWRGSTFGCFNKHASTTSFCSASTTPQWWYVHALARP